MVSERYWLERSQLGHKADWQSELQYTTTGIFDRQRLS